MPMSDGAARLFSSRTALLVGRCMTLWVPSRGSSRTRWVAYGRDRNGDLTQAPRAATPPLSADAQW
jgi:hypothetical protein